ncbi:MAG TPA: SDR family NAD(P)-dependent oxidoreductase [Dehalococcoidia bacterium]|nr:SDR family NAD(P)-dependent oxidoreductase [Dehalococcoidia bacterium]
MANRLAGKVAIVTGGGRGIGRAEALLLAAEGAAVVVNDMGGSSHGEGASPSPADEVVAEIKAAGGRAVANYDNVAEMRAGENMVKAALDGFGRLDILVNNAGILRDRMIFNMSEEEWDAVIAVHLKGHFTVTRAASIIFRQQRSGRIISTSSESGLGNMGQANYSAAKEGIVGLTRTLARDLGRYGVTANAIRPRAASRLTISDEMRAAAARSQQTGVSAGVPDGGGPGSIAAMLPEHVAPLVAYLATDEAAYVNGRNFVVGGDLISLLSEPEPIRTIINPNGFWTLDELMTHFKQTVGAGVRNQWPPQTPKP